MKLRTLSALLLALLAASGVQAALLSDLLRGGLMTAGDKLFDQWEFIHFIGSDLNRGFDPANIKVEPLNDGGLDPGPGLQFTVSNGELDVTGNGIYAFADLMFGFRVSVLDPKLKIKDNSLEITQAFLGWDDDGSNDLGAYIETAGTIAGGNDLSQISAEFSVLNGDVTSVDKAAAHSPAFAPQQEIWVTKNIIVWSVDRTDTAYLQGFEQRFSQQSVPEPGSLALAALALAGLGLSRRRPR